MELFLQIGLWYLIIYLFGTDHIRKVGVNTKGNGHVENNNDNIAMNYDNNNLMVRECMLSFSSLSFVAVVVLFLLALVFLYIIILFCLLVVFG